MAHFVIHGPRTHAAICTMATVGLKSLLRKPPTNCNLFLNGCSDLRYHISADLGTHMLLASLLE